VGVGVGECVCGCVCVSPVQSYKDFTMKIIKHGPVGVCVCLCVR